jgi:wyosine [tRNA(Phe)-imidazoG37] synthetase (radical SAM superfamily)
MIAFGPVPSRRLGQSLGINHIPHKVCSYNCAYCQVGHSTRRMIERRAFFSPADIAGEVERKVEAVRSAGGALDYLTFVPDGEPGLDIGLGDTIRRLRPLKIPIAIISNASLVWRPDVREDFAQADLVSLKVDAVLEKWWRKINRPHADLSLAAILEGILEFAAAYPGELITETMLLKGMNDNEENLSAIASYLGGIRPSAAYVCAPTRPPAEAWAQAPDEESLARAYQLFSGQVEKVELLIGYAPESFAPAGDAAQNILDITFVHPMRESEALETLAQSDADPRLLDELVNAGKLARVEYEGIRFYVRRILG